MTTLDLLIRGATVYPGDAPPFEGDVGVSGGAVSLVTLCHEDSPPPEAHEVVDGRRPDALPGLHRPAHALRSAVVRRPAPDAEACPGLHDRGDQPRRPRARPRRTRAAVGAPGVPAAARRRRSRDVAVVDGRGVPRRARRHPAGALARALDRPRCRARAGARKRAGRAGRREPARHATRGPPRPRGRCPHALVRARLPAGRLRRHRRARRGRRGGRRLRRAARAPCPERGARAARGRRRDDRRRPPLRRPTAHLAPQVARRREPDRAAARASRERGHRARRHVRPVPVRRRQHLAREHPAGLGAGGRRSRNAPNDRPVATTGAASRSRSPTGCRAGRTSSARSGRSRSRSRTRHRRTRTPSAGRWRRSAPSAAAIRSRRPST